MRLLLRLSLPESNVSSMYIIILRSEDNHSLVSKRLRKSSFLPSL